MPLKSSNLKIADYMEMRDEDVVSLAQKGDIQALNLLIIRYKGFIQLKARSYFLIGGDSEDVFQEGLLGFCKAVQVYDENKLASFKGFSQNCVKCQIITAIKAATRKKHRALNSYVSLNQPIYNEDSDRTLLDVLSNTGSTDPEELVIHNENLCFIEARVSEILSDLELKVFQSYLDGSTYEEIALSLNCQRKSVDNALQRVKRKFSKSTKLKEYLNNY